MCAQGDLEEIDNVFRWMKRIYLISSCADGEEGEDCEDDDDDDDGDDDEGRLI